jgi:hypothetical protein
METCTVETGLLRKAPCGGNAVAKCANCEQSLCTKHALAQLNAAGKKTGTFLCPQCNAAQRDIAKIEAKAAAAPKPLAAAPKPAASAAPVAAKPAAPAAKPAAASPAAAKPPAEKPKPLQENSDGSIDFTPSKK